MRRNFTVIAWLIVSIAMVVAVFAQPHPDWQNVAAVHKPNDSLVRPTISPWVEISPRKFSAELRRDSSKRLTPAASPYVMASASYGPGQPQTRSSSSPRPTASGVTVYATAEPTLQATSPPKTPQPIAVGANGLPSGVAYAADSDPVRIDSIVLSSDVVRGGDLASARVTTTSNAATLTARIGTYQVNVPRVAPGIFEISMKVPHLPVAGQTVNIIVTAIRSDGATTQKTIPVRVSF